MKIKARSSRPSLRSTGWAFVIIGILVQLAAFNTGQNLFYLIAGAFGSFVGLSYFLARRSTRGLTVLRRAPEKAERGVPFATEVRIENSRLLLPAIALRIESAGSSAQGIGFLQKIPAGKAGIVRSPVCLAKRGVHRLGPVRLSSGFPFGLFVAETKFPDESTVLVYPRVRPIRDRVLKQMEGTGEYTHLRRGEGDDFFCLREYVPGDDPRRIVWRLSARTGKILVRELEPKTSRYINIVFDTKCQASDGDAPHEDPAEIFEDVVDVVASLAIAFLNKQYSVSLTTPEEVVDLGMGEKHGEKILRMLASVEPMDPDEDAKDTPLVAREVRGAANVYVSADPTRWGASSGARGGRVVNPREVASV